MSSAALMTGKNPAITPELSRTVLAGSFHRDEPLMANFVCTQIVLSA